MPKKPNAPFARILKQVLLLALPLILKAIKNRKASAGSKPSSGKVTSRGEDVQLTPKPTKARKRESSKPLPEPPESRKDASRPASADRSAAATRGSLIAELFRQRRSDVILTDAGTIVHILPDDNEGSRHQRLLVEVDHCDVTIKIAHNIDLAPRVPARKGDRLTFKGEYEWNEMGGAVHWTHHDPKQWREGGWIEHEGNRYE